MIPECQCAQGKQAPLPSHAAIPNEEQHHDKKLAREQLRRQNQSDQ